MELVHYREEYKPEAEKLANMLLEAGINYSRYQLYDGFQVKVFDKDGNVLDDAVCHSYSHGHEKGLLETYHFGDCTGYETAEQIFEGWKEMVKNSKKVVYK